MEFLPLEFRTLESLTLDSLTLEFLTTEFFPNDFYSKEFFSFSSPSASGIDSLAAANCAVFWLTNPGVPLPKEPLPEPFASGPSALLVPYFWEPSCCDSLCCELLLAAFLDRSILFTLSGMCVWAMVWAWFGGGVVFWIDADRSTSYE